MMHPQRKNQLTATLRLIFYCTVPILLTLTYLSLLNREEKLIAINQKVSQIESRLDYLSNNIQFNAFSLQSESTKDEYSSPYPNILTEDPFYTDTLPKLLGPNFKIQGTRYQAFLGKPENLHPYNNFANVSMLWDLCSRSMARTHVGFYDRLSPSLADRIEIRPRKGDEENPDFLDNPESSGEYWVFMRKDLYWQPLDSSHFPPSMELNPHFFHRHKVTAHDVKFYLDAILNPNVQLSGVIAQRELYDDIESFELIDDYSFIIRWKRHKLPHSNRLRAQYNAKDLVAGLRPLPRFVFQYYADGTKIVEDDRSPDTYRNHSVWAQTFTEHWAQHTVISCGDWYLNYLTPNEMDFKRNSYAPDPYGALNKKLAFTLKDSVENAWNDFKNNELDFFSLPARKALEWEQFKQTDQYKTQEEEGDQIFELRYPSASFVYIGWNLQRPLFKDKEIRKALTLAINRKGMIDQLLNNLARELTGPFYIGHSGYDKKVKAYPYDPVAAVKLLEKNGWFDKDGDGIREKIIDGETIPFSFHLTYYVKNQSSKIQCEYIADQLKQIGVECLLNGVDIADYSQATDDKEFDALYGGWMTSYHFVNTRQLWHSSSAKNKGSSNMIGFENPRIDEIIDLLDYTYDSTERKTLLNEFHQIIYEESPYTFMYTPMSILLLRERLHNVFIPANREDLIPGATVEQPLDRLFYTTSKQAINL